MRCIPDLSTRAQAPELMDDPHCDSERLYRTLDQFGVINRHIARTLQMFKRFAASRLLLVRSHRPVVLDIGCGGGDFLRQISRWAAAASFKIRLIGIDSDPRIVAYAREKCIRFEDIEIHLCDMAACAHLGVPVDVITCNHLLHHLDDTGLLYFFSHVAPHARHAVVCNDIRRCYQAYVLYTCIARILFHRSFAWYDGRVSIRNAFTHVELQRLLEKAGVRGRFTVSRASPFRLVVHYP
jgi:2-polyprenyl-3-methyl-5-hydroxy-6-metoxy-1,4-benzoquinol methylase